MRDVVRHVEEERLAARLGVVEEAEGVVGQDVGLVERRVGDRHVLDRDLLAVEEERVLPRPVRGDEELVDDRIGERVVEVVPGVDVVGHPAAEVFLAGHGGVVAGVAQQPPQRARVAGVALGEEEPGVQGRPRRLALRHVVELREAQAALGEPVEVRGAYLRPVGADVGVADVVGHDEDHVRAFRRLAGRGIGDAERCRRREQGEQDVGRSAAHGRLPEALSPRCRVADSGSAPAPIVTLTPPPCSPPRPTVRSLSRGADSRPGRASRDGSAWRPDRARRMSAAFDGAGAYRRLTAAAVGKSSGTGWVTSPVAAHSDAR